jgi:hypothetical protein
VHGYIGDFVGAIDNALPDEEPGSSVYKQLADIYVSRDNKRRIVTYIKTGSRTYARVTYILPVMKEASRIFQQQEALIPDGGAPVMNEVAVPAGSSFEDAIRADAAANNVFSWKEEIDRVRHIAESEPAGKRKAMANNIVLYWSRIRTYIMKAFERSSITIEVARASSNRRTASVYPSSPRSSSAHSRRTSTASTRSRRTSTASTHSRRTSTGKSKRTTDPRVTSNPI